MLLLAIVASLLMSLKTSAQTIASDSLNNTSSDTVIIYDEPVVIKKSVYVKTKKIRKHNSYFILNPALGGGSYLDYTNHCNCNEDYAQKRYASVRPAISYNFSLYAKYKNGRKNIMVGAQYLKDREEFTYEDNGNLVRNINSYNFIAAKMGVGYDIIAKERISLSFNTGLAFLFLSNIQMRDIDTGNVASTIVVSNDNFNKTLASYWADLLLSIPTPNKKLKITLALNYLLNLKSLTIDAYPSNIYRSRYGLSLGIEYFFKTGSKVL